MIATGNYPQAVMDNVLENLNQAQQQIAIFQSQVQVQQDALLVVERQMNYTRQPAFPPVCSAVTRTTITSEEFTVNEVYVIAGGEWLRNNLNAIACIYEYPTWDSIEKIALTLSVVAVAFMWVQRHNVMDLLGWVAVFVLISLLVMSAHRCRLLITLTWSKSIGWIMFRSVWRCHFLLRPVSGMRWWSATR